MRLLLPLAVAISLLAANAARGDLYTDGVLSVEWLVDSADEIHRVRCSSPDDQRRLPAELLETIKPLSGKTALSREQIAGLGSPYGARPGEEWLLFVRLYAEAEPRLVRGINLTQPLMAYQWAAVDRRGEPIGDREAILAKVAARTKLDRRLPPRCDRDAVDRMIGESGRSSPPDMPRGMDPLGTPAPLDRYLGGVRIEIDCDYWDTGGGGLDTWIHRTVVPVEPEDRPRLLEAARLGKKYDGPVRYHNPIAALVNFPDKETESVLEEILAEYADNYPMSYVARQRWMMVRSVLDYIVLWQQPEGPLNKELVGRWRLVGRQEIIDLAFHEDNTFAGIGYHRDPKRIEREPVRWRGRGRWIVRDGQLTICRASKMKHGRPNVRVIFKHKPIVEVTSDEVVLEGGPPMKRR